MKGDIALFNFTSEFEKVFDELADIETELLNYNDKSKDKIQDRLLNLRKEIDQCIGYWLQFEERLWLLQEQYGIDIPDQLDESLISAYLGLSDLDTTNLDLLKDDQKTNYTTHGSNQDHEKYNTYVNSDELEKQDTPQDASNKSIEYTNIAGFRKGLGYFDLAMLEEATNEFEKVISSDPDLTMAHYFLGLAYYFQKEYEQALKKFRLTLELIEDEEIKSAICNTIGNIYIDKGEESRALNYFLQASKTSVSPDVLFNCGAIYFNFGEYQRSLEFFLSALDNSEQSDKDWELHLYTGKTYTYLGELDKALEHLQIAHNTHPNNSEIHFELGLIYQLKRNEQKAIREYVMARKLSQQSDHSNTDK